MESRAAESVDGYGGGTGAIRWIQAGGETGQRKNMNLQHGPPFPLAKSFLSPSASTIIPPFVPLRLRVKIGVSGYAQRLGTPSGLWPIGDMPKHTRRISQIQHSQAPWL